MPAQKPTVGQIAQRFGKAFLDTWGDHVPHRQHRALEALASCHTPRLGGHLEYCTGDGCGHWEVVCNSCKSRNCPGCQGFKAAKWVEARYAEVLDVPYFHVVFTLPGLLAPLALQNPKLVYSLLFTAAGRTLIEVAANPEFLGVQIGLLALLHTWGQTLSHHPHIHCVVPGGGIARLADTGEERWISSGDKFFLPVSALSQVFRGKVLQGLEGLYRDARLTLTGSLAPLQDAAVFKNLLRKAASPRWVVHCKPPFQGSPETLFKYVARYSHRIAISNARIQKVEHGKVTFRYKDYANGAKKKLMTLDAVEFLRRFLTHVLPDGFTRIRSYGLLANRQRKANITRCRTLIAAYQRSPSSLPRPEDNPEPSAPPDSPEISAADPDLSKRICPRCRTRRLVRGVSVSPEITVQLAAKGYGHRQPLPPMDTS